MMLSRFWYSSKLRKKCLAHSGVAYSKNQSNRSQSVTLLPTCHLHCERASSEVGRAQSPNVGRSIPSGDAQSDFDASAPQTACKRKTFCFSFAKGLVC